MLIVTTIVSVDVLVPSLTVTSKVAVVFDSPSGAVKVGDEADSELKVTDVPPV